MAGENYDVAVRAHSDPLPNSTLVHRTVAPAPWFLFAGSASSMPAKRRKGCKIFADAVAFHDAHGRPTCLASSSFEQNKE
jgi:hypothetical protein